MSAASNTLECHLCGCTAVYQFDQPMLGHYIARYFRCRRCDLLQVEAAPWLDSVYQDAVHPCDVRMVSRNLAMRECCQRIIARYCPQGQRFLDYGGGTGLFTRLMRDAGYEFYRHDAYAPNLFARYFDRQNLPVELRHFDLVTCFEVVEHALDPASIWDELFTNAPLLLCSTCLLPEWPPDRLRNWPYLGSEHGQHLAFYSPRTLAWLATRYGKHHHSAGDLHFFAPFPVPDFPKIVFPPVSWRKRLAPALRRWLSRAENGVHRQSLLDADAEAALRRTLEATRG